MEVEKCFAHFEIFAVATGVYLHVGLEYISRVDDVDGTVKALRNNPSIDLVQFVENELV